MQQASAKMRRAARPGSLLAQAVPSLPVVPSPQAVICFKFLTFQKLHTCAFLLRLCNIRILVTVYVKKILVGRRIVDNDGVARKTLGPEWASGMFIFIIVRRRVTSGECILGLLHWSRLDFYWLRYGGQESQ